MFPLAASTRHPRGTGPWPIPLPVLLRLLSPAVQGGCSAGGYHHASTARAGSRDLLLWALAPCLAELTTAGDQLQGATAIFHVFPWVIKKKGGRIVVFLVKINKEEEKPKPVNRNYSPEPSGVKDHHRNEGCLC